MGRGRDHQKLSCTYQGAATSAFFQLRFVDQFGGEYDTRPIKIDTTTMTAEQNANSIQDALEALPNFAIPEIEIDVNQGTKKTPGNRIYCRSSREQNVLLEELSRSSKCLRPTTMLTRETSSAQLRDKMLTQQTLKANTESLPHAPTVVSVTKALADATASMATLVLPVTM